ncbi:uncharacterized protein [Primulina eburnea]|uniref:uncharacterized protein isoform X2 n=1 Tax=Primulina eburnea TaxID=1245227 RepID=UPI003C6C3ED3
MQRVRGRKVCLTVCYQFNHFSIHATKAPNLPNKSENRGQEIANLVLPILGGGAVEGGMGGRGSNHRLSSSVSFVGSRISFLMLYMFATMAALYVAGRLWQDAGSRVYLINELDRRTGLGQAEDIRCSSCGAGES